MQKKSIQGSFPIPFKSQVWLHRGVAIIMADLPGSKNKGGKIFSDEKKPHKSIQFSSIHSFVETLEMNALVLSCGQ